MSASNAEDLSRPVAARSASSARTLTVAGRVPPLLALAILISALAGAGKAVIVGLSVLTLAVTLTTGLLAARQQRGMAKSLSRLQRAAAGELLPDDAAGGSSDALTVATEAVLSHLSHAVQLLQTSSDIMAAGAASVFDTSRQACENAEGMAGQAIAAASSAEQISGSVESVAAATEELTASI